MLEFLKYLKTELPSNWIYTEEANLNWDGGDTTLILKTQTGTSYRDSQVIPFQMVVLTNDPISVKGILEVFAQSKMNNYFTLGLKTCKQSYFTPIIPTVATSSGNQLTSQVILAGTLIISENVSDIKKVEIDGTEYETTVRRISYVSSMDANTNINSTSGHQKSRIKSCLVQVVLEMMNKNNAFCNSLLGMRKGTTAPETTFVLKLYHTENNVNETYTMNVSNFSIESNNFNMPVIHIEFMEA